MTTKTTSLAYIAMSEFTLPVPGNPVIGFSLDVVFAVEQTIETCVTVRATVPAIRDEAWSNTERRIAQSAAALLRIAAQSSVEEIAEHLAASWPPPPEI